MFVLKIKKKCGAEASPGRFYEKLKLTISLD